MLTLVPLISMEKFQFEFRKTIGCIELLIWDHREVFQFEFRKTIGATDWAARKLGNQFQFEFRKTIGSRSGRNYRLPAFSFNSSFVRL